MERYGLIGEKLGHSYSKIIHEWLGYRYDLMELTKEEAGEFLMKRRFDGLNVTIPYKKMVMDHCDEVTDLAKRIGAVNTIYRKREATEGSSHGGSKEQGILVGTNTDYEGLRYAAKRAGIDMSGRKVLILGGSGGAGSMARVLAEDEGSSEIFIATRGPLKTDSHVSYDDLPEDAHVVINATPVGTYPNIYESPVDLRQLKNCKGVIDLTYNPLRTQLLVQASQLGIKNTNGLPMLVRQAVAAAGFFLEGVESETFLSKTEALIARLESQMENIVLIGMPGCGKSSIGKRAAARLGRRFVDTDTYIKTYAGSPPADIIKKQGEQAFRRIETAAIKEMAMEHGLVIATGGGAVLERENVDALKRNGRLIFIDRDPDKLSTFNRPLSQNGGVYRLYDERYDIYLGVCDERIENNGEDFAAAIDKVVCNKRCGVI